MPFRSRMRSFRDVEGSESWVDGDREVWRYVGEGERGGGGGGGLEGFGDCEDD